MRAESVSLLCRYSCSHTDDLEQIDHRRARPTNEEANGTRTGKKVMKHSPTQRFDKRRIVGRKQTVQLQSKTGDYENPDLAWTVYKARVMTRVHQPQTTTNVNRLKIKKKKQQECYGSVCRERGGAGRRLHVYRCGQMMKLAKALKSLR